MPTCVTCSRPLRAESRFCPGCGTVVNTRFSPSPPLPDSPQHPVQGPRRAGHRTTVGFAVVAVVAVIALGIGAGFVLRPFAGRTVSGMGTAADTAATTSSTAPAQQRPPVAAPSTAADAHIVLAARADADQPIVDSLVGYWVPQISSKAPGMVVSGITYDDSRILTEFRTALRAHTGAVLLRSEDYTSFSRAGFWVIVVAEPHATPDEANEWCEHNNFPPADCFAKRLSHTEGPQGNTVHRG